MNMVLYLNYFPLVKFAIVQHGPHNTWCIFFNIRLILIENQVIMLSKWSKEWSTEGESKIC